MLPLRLAVSVSLVLLSSTSALPIPAPSAAAAVPEAGVMHVGAIGIHRTTAEIMAAGAAAAAAPKHIRPRLALQDPDRRSLPQNPAAEERARVPDLEPESGTSRGAAGPPQTFTPQTVAISFDGATLAQTGGYPPDNMGAVGPEQYVVFLNGRLRCLSRSGALSGGLDVDPDIFFASVMTPIGGGVALNFTSDPQVRYDRFTARWFLTMMDVPCADGSCVSLRRNRIMIAVSDAASAGVISPATVWTFFHLYADATDFSDRPNLGVDARALYFGADEFSTTNLSYTGSSAVVVRKTSILGAGPIVYTTFSDIGGPAEGPFAPVCADNLDPQADEGYVIGVSSATFGRLVARRIGDPGGTPTISPNLLLTVPSTSFPIDVTHLGGTMALDATDDRLCAAHIRNGRLWTAHNIAVNASGIAATSGTARRTGIRWYELTGIRSTEGGGVPAVVQSGTIFDPAAVASSARQHWMPSVAVSGQGHAAFGFSSAGAPYRVNAGTLGRLATDVLGTTGALALYTGSTTAYNPPFNRWGDYSFTSLDPLDDMTLWTIEQYCDATNSYACRVAKLLAPPPATPAVAPAVEAGHASTVVTLTGASTSGSAFHDPGPDLPPPAIPFTHVTVSVGDAGFGGTPPTVNGVTYLDPLHLELDLNTTGATPTPSGMGYNVTVTNPDGQFIIGAGLLEVLPASSAVPGGPGSGVGIESVIPNPTTGRAEITFAIPREQRVSLTVLDLQGREIASLVNGTRGAGRHVLQWDGRRGGAPAPSGVYFVRLRAGSFEQQRRLFVTR